jgi:hypothetical protein
MVTSQPLTIDEALTTTWAVRRRVDLSRDVDPAVRYDLKLWIGHLFEGAAYLPS